MSDKLIIFDTTLRDGEQTPGVVFRKEDRVEIAKILDSLGIDRIEAGMPIVSYFLNSEGSAVFAGY